MSLSIDRYDFRQISPGRYLLYIEKNTVKDVASKLKENGAMFLFLSTIDNPENGTIELAYVFRHVYQKILIIVKTSVDRRVPVISSISDIFPGARYSEAEAYDLMGVLFEGNPELKRGIFSPYDVVEKDVFPLRKDAGV